MRSPRRKAILVAVTLVSTAALAVGVYLNEQRTSEYPPYVYPFTIGEAEGDFIWWTWPDRDGNLLPLRLKLSTPTDAWLRSLVSCAPWVGETSQLSPRPAVPLALFRLGPRQFEWYGHSIGQRFKTGMLWPRERARLWTAPEFDAMYAKYREVGGQNWEPKDLLAALDDAIVGPTNGESKGTATDDNERRGKP